MQWMMERRQKAQRSAQQSVERHALMARAQRQAQPERV
jgi:hypothetical protein